MQPLPSSCSKLQVLQLHRCHIGLSAVLNSVPALTRLDMSEGSTLPALPAGLKPLSQLTALQHLKCALRESQTGVPFPAGVLSHLTSLTYLSLPHFKINEESVRGFDRLQNLQECSFGPAIRMQGSPFVWPGFSDRLVASEALAAVSGLQQLTFLSLTRSDDVSKSTAPGLSTLTALRDLSLMDCGRFIPAGFLEHMTNLTRLHLRDSNVVIVQLLQMGQGQCPTELLKQTELLYISIV